MHVFECVEGLHKIFNTFCIKELNYKLKNPLGNAMGKPRDNMEAKESKAYEMI
jgi:hypothetical protein